MYQEINKTIERDGYEITFDYTEARRNYFGEELGTEYMPEEIDIIEVKQDGMKLDKEDYDEREIDNIIREYLNLI